MVTLEQEVVDRSLQTREIAELGNYGLQTFGMNGSDRTPFYERLEAMAAEAGFSMNRLGQAIGKSGPAMLKWKNGKSKPTLETRRDIARVLKRPLADLLFDDEASEMARPDLGEGYPSLRSFLANHPDARATDDEIYWLASQRFPEEYGDIVDDEWWMGQLMRYRGLMLRQQGKAPTQRARKPESGRKGA